MSDAALGSALPPDRREIIRRIMDEVIRFHRLLGLRLEQAERGRVVLRVPWKDDLIGDPVRPAVHGGVISALIDAAGGAACFTMLEKTTDRVSTVDLRVDYLRPGLPGDLVCESAIVRIGNRVAVVRSHVYRDRLPEPGEADESIATGQAVYNVVRR